MILTSWFSFTKFAPRTNYWFTFTHLLSRLRRFFNHLTNVSGYRNYLPHTTTLSSLDPIIGPIQHDTPFPSSTTYTLPSSGTPRTYRLPRHVRPWLFLSVSTLPSKVYIILRLRLLFDVLQNLPSFCRRVISAHLRWRLSHVISLPDSPRTPTPLSLLYYDNSL